MPRVLTTTALCLVLGFSGASFATQAPVIGASEIDQLTVMERWQISREELEMFEREWPKLAPFADPNMTPLEVLGMTATSETQKRLYAKRFVELRALHVKRSLEWSTYVEEAAREVAAAAMIQNSPAIQRSLASERHRLKRAQREWFGWDQQPSSFEQLARRGVLFVEPSCRECDQEFQRLIKQVEQGLLKGIDVVFAGMTQPDRAVITQWAMANGIDQVQTQTRQVTLNYEGERWRAARAGRDTPLYLGPRQ